jgi:hypothetical protein
LDLALLTRIQAGLSGAEVYRIGGYCLKQHPLGSLGRILKVHQAQQRWAKAVAGPMPCPVPALVLWPSQRDDPLTGTCLVSEDCFWECMECKPGVAFESIEQVTVEHLQSVGTSLGFLHRIARGWEADKVSATSGQFRPDERMSRRNELVQDLVRNRFQAPYRALLGLDRFGSNPRVEDPMLCLIEQALQSAHGTLEHDKGSFERLVGRSRLQHWMHGDAWRGNWLFQGSIVSGLIDFSLADIRWPGFDFARAIGSMSCLGGEGWTEAWKAYCEVLGDPGYLLEDAILMHRISTVLTLVNYVDRLRAEPFLDPRLQDRLREICSVIIGDFEESC